MAEAVGSLLVSRILQTSSTFNNATEGSDNWNRPTGFGSNSLDNNSNNSNNYGNNNPSSSTNGAMIGGRGVGDDGTGRQAYEFVAFLLWYLFLVLCCLLPTCCAYRRRRLMEARLVQQQANFDQIHQQNVFILSNLHLRQGGMIGGVRLDMDSEEARAERTKRITAALKSTTFVSRKRSE
jgi:hypothetical protein